MGQECLRYGREQRGGVEWLAKKALVTAIGCPLLVRGFMAPCNEDHRQARTLGAYDLAQFEAVNDGKPDICNEAVKPSYYSLFNQRFGARKKQSRVTGGFKKVLDGLKNSHVVIDDSYGPSCDGHFLIVPARRE